MIYNFQKERKGKPLTPKQKKYINKKTYRCLKKHYKQIAIRIRYDQHQDVIDHLAKQESLVNYIIALIEKDIKGE